ncbi:MAG TPA: hypothetical protein VMD08_13900, partial [Candidatus Baltobacteraceae bacterium]|nr:hypothetical protein [Candidatus Baltobacteraceae bacterium]
MAAKRVMHLWRDGIRHPGQGGLRRTLAVLAVLFLLTSTWSAAADTDPHRQDEIMATQISRVLPAVVGILAEVGAEVTVRCGPGDVRTVQADPE